MLSAPVFIVCVADIRCRIKEDVDVSLNENSPQEEFKQIIRDTSISVEHILLGADKYVAGIITLGYANETPKARPRKKLEELIHYENW